MRSSEKQLCTTDSFTLFTSNKRTELHLLFYSNLSLSCDRPRMQIIRPMHTRKPQPLGNLGQMTIYRDGAFVFANKLGAKMCQNQKAISKNQDW